MPELASRKAISTQCFVQYAVTSNFYQLDSLSRILVSEQSLHISSVYIFRCVKLQDLK
jgi:hypothetical protein